MFLEKRYKMNRVSVTDLNFVRIEPRGKGVANKFWVEQNGILKLVKPSNFTDQDIIESLSFYILNAIGLECAEVELGYDKYADQNNCLVTNFLKEGESSYEITDWKLIFGKDDEEELKMCFEQVFQKYANLFSITTSNLEKLKKQYICQLFGKCILENFDTKLDNIGLVFNEKTTSYRLPSSYDNGCAFINYDSITKPTCYVGNQIFIMEQVVEYILTNYLNYVEDIIANFHKFMEQDIEIVLKPWLDQLTEKKNNYIIKYLYEMDAFVQGYIKRKNK